jgi:hypothetical protein
MNIREIIQDISNIGWSLLTVIVIITLTLLVLLSLFLFDSLIFSYCYRSSLSSLCFSNIYVCVKDILNSDSSF